MYSNSTLYRNALFVLTLVAWGVSARAQSDASGIVVVYPKAGQTIAAVDSTFILGSITRSLMRKVPASASAAQQLTLKINGVTVDVHPDGGFLGFLPVKQGEFVFELKVVGGDRHARMTTLAEYSLPILVGAKQDSIAADSLIILGDYRPPSGDLGLMTGDRVECRFRGTSGAVGWFSIPGVIDSVPMSESALFPTPYWGEAAFGDRVVAESTPSDGIYSGFWIVPESARCSAVEIVYHLFQDRHPPVRGKQVDAKSGYRVTLNGDQFPFTVRFVDSIQTLRVGPKLGYFSILQPRGATALVVGAEGDWLRLRLSATQFAWAAKGSVERMAAGTMPASSRLSSIRCVDSANSVTLAFPLSAVHPYRVIEETPRKLAVQLFGVTSNTDWIRSEYSDTLIDYCTWVQQEDGLYELTINLRSPLWGYDCYYSGNTFYLKILAPPKNPRSFKGKTIVVDPGHSADPGSTGPTGFTEAEANLGIALALRDMLISKGANVIMTRRDMSNVALADRPVLAKAAGADLFVSIHNNSLPDGVNPFVNNGTSVIYYHPGSRDLARSILGELLKATGLSDHGLYWGNLAVNRPTQYPAVLVECDFMILPEREALLKSKGYQNKLAAAIAQGIENYLRNYPNGR